MINPFLDPVKQKTKTKKEKSGGVLSKATLYVDDLYHKKITCTMFSCLVCVVVIDGQQLSFPIEAVANSLPKYVL